MKRCKNKRKNSLFLSTEAFIFYRGKQRADSRRAMEYRQNFNSILIIYLLL